ncbi:MAG: hypothetical protein SFY67_05100 [Candidatus Melainabacteria bacterium]|nr:hypothetical protein [Candidatus Melainabacteria bacterium]
MTAKKQIVYNGKLKQPAHSRTKEQWKIVFDELSSELQVSAPLLTTQWLREIGTKLTTRHCRISEESAVRLFREMDRQELIKEVLHNLIPELVPAFRIATANAGRPKEWKLVSKMVLYSRLNRILRDNAKYKWSPEKAAEKLLKSNYHRFEKPKSLARKFREIEKNIKVIQQEQDESLTSRIQNFFKQLPETEIFKIKKIMQLISDKKLSLSEAIDDPLILQWVLLFMPTAAAWAVIGEMLVDSKTDSLTKQRLESLLSKAV